MQNYRTGLLQRNSFSEAAKAAVGMVFFLGSLTPVAICFTLAENLLKIKNLGVHISEDGYTYIDNNEKVIRSRPKELRYHRFPQQRRGYWRNRHCL